MTRLILNILQVAVGSDLLQCLEAFITDRYITGLAKWTIDFYRNGLTSFMGYCSVNGVGSVADITPNIIRRYLMALEQDHKPGGVHAKYRAVRTSLNWYKVEEENPEWVYPIKTGFQTNIRL